MNANLLDRALAVLSPSWAMRRVRTRAAFDLVSRHFEGASGGKRTARWKAPTTGPNAAAAGALGRLRDRCRDLARNNPWAQCAIDVIATNVVGSGIIPTPVGGSTRSLERARAVWKDWAETPACDADERQDIYGIQNLVETTVDEAGECLIRRRRRRVTDSLPIPLQLQVLEPDMLDDTRDRLIGVNGDRIVGGVQFNALGRRVGYWIFEEHPGEALTLGGSFTSNFIPASEILHVFNVKRPGQVRGIPALASAVVRLRELDELEDAALVREKIAACFAAFERDLDGLELDDGGLDPAKGEDEQTIEPGTIRKLSAGRTIEFTRPPAHEGMEPLQRSQLRAIAKSAGITYEQLTGDYSQVNYSSARAAGIEASRINDRRRWITLVPQLLGGRRGGIWGWMTDAGELAGQSTLGVGARWTPPRRQLLDPQKEIEATTAAVRSGFSSLSEALREFGQHPEDVLNEIARDNAKLDELGISLDSDGRRPQGGGAPAAAPAEPDEASAGASEGKPPTRAPKRPATVDA